MMQDCASANKIKENKYKILRMSLLLGSDDDREETLNNFEDAARDIDTMNDEIYQKDLEDKFYDTLKLEEEEKKLAVLVDYIGGRVEQRISLLSDFSNVTGFDLTNLPPIKYYDKLDDYKERLKYIREYLGNTKQITLLNQEIDDSEKKLKEAYLNKATSEEANRRNEEIILNKFEKFIKNTSGLNEVDELNLDNKLNEVISLVEESKKSLDIFSKSFSTLRGSGISYEEEEEYKSYVENAKQVYYTNKEQEYLLRIYQYLLRKEEEYSSIIIKREAINEIIYDRMSLRKELNINEADVLSNIYDLLDRQYEEIRKQKENIESIDNLNEIIAIKKEQVNELELENQKVEILALLREFCLIDTYEEESEDITTEQSITEETEIFNHSDIFSKVEPENSTEKSIFESSIEIPNIDLFGQKEKVSEVSSATDKSEPQEEVKDNEVVLVEDCSQIDLDLIQAKAGKVMQRVGEMLGIKPKTDTVVSVENKAPEIETKVEEQKIETENTTEIPENPLFSNQLDSEPQQEEPMEHNFWFESETPDALNELPDLSVSNDNFFANNNIPDLNFPDLKLNFGNNEEENK